MIDFASLQKEALQKEIKVFPQHKLRASSLGDPCERRLYYGIVNWQDRIHHDATMQSIFNVGNVLEEHHAIPLLNKMRGLRVIEQQTAFALQDPDITMHIDGKLLVTEENEYVDEKVGAKIPFEIKTTTPWDFHKLSSMEDFTRSKKWYQRAYVAQLQLYLLGTSSEIGYLVLVNKVTGELKFIQARLDFEFCDALIAKAKAIYASITVKNPPPHTEEIELCQRCDFRHICQPTMSFNPIKILDQEGLISRLDERETLKESVDRFEELDAEIKEDMKKQGRGEFLVGGFAIKVVDKERKEYTVKASKYTETRIAKLT